MGDETFLVQLLKDSLADARKVSWNEFGRLVDETTLAILAAALFAERARIGSSALEQAVLGKTQGGVPDEYGAGQKWAEDSR